MLPTTFYGNQKQPLISRPPKRKFPVFCPVKRRNDMNTLPAADGKGFLGVVAATMGEAFDLGSIKKPNKADPPVTLGFHHH